MRKELKKIIHVVDNLAIGGVSSVLFSLLTNLQKTEPSLIHVIVYINDGEHRALFEEAGFSTIKINPYIPRYPLLLLPQLYRIVRRERPDLIHALLPHSWLHGRLVGWLTGTPTVCGIHGDVSHKEHGRFQRLCMFLMGHLANHYICISQQTSDALIQNQNRLFDPARTTIIYNGVAPSLLHKKAATHPLTRADLGIQENAFLIGCVSRLSSEKSVDVLIRAFAHIHAQKNSHPVQLCIVGDGGEMLKLRTLVNDLGLAGDVFFVGVQANPFPFYPLFDCLVLSSATEGGVALVLLEAMSFGVPVITTHDREMHEQIKQGENGFFVPVNDTRSIATKINLLLRNQVLRQKIGEAGKKTVEEKYTAQRVAQHYLETFQRVAAEK